MPKPSVLWNEHFILFSLFLFICPRQYITLQYVQFKKPRPIWHDLVFPCSSECVRTLTLETPSIRKCETQVYMCGPNGTRGRRTRGKALFFFFFMGEHSEPNVFTEFHPFVKMPCCSWFMSTSKHRLGRATLSLWSERHYEWNIKWNQLRNRTRGTCLWDSLLYRLFNT